MEAVSKDEKVVEEAKLPYTREELQMMVVVLNQVSVSGEENLDRMSLVIKKTRLLLEKMKNQT